MACFTGAMFDEKPPASSKKLFSWQLILFIVLALIGLAGIVFGLYTLTVFSNQGCIVEESIPEASASALLPFSQGLIYVDLAGAVKDPGIYQLAAGSRLATAIDQAGGFIPQTDAAYVSQELNLAKKLKDGDKIYIFSQEEREYHQDAIEFCQKLNTSSTQVDNQGIAQISINNASAEDLQTLEGIGEKRTEEILAGRPYQSLGELVEKEILTESLFNKIQNQIKL